MHDLICNSYERVKSWEFETGTFTVHWTLNESPPIYFLYKTTFFIIKWSFYQGLCKSTLSFLCPECSGTVCCALFLWSCGAPNIIMHRDKHILSSTECRNWRRLLMMVAEAQLWFHRSWTAMAMVQVNQEASICVSCAIVHVAEKSKWDLTNNYKNTK